METSAIDHSATPLYLVSEDRTCTYEAFFLPRIPLNAPSSPVGPFATWILTHMHLASGEGFEPSRTEVPTGLANPPLQPLGYPDILVGEEGIEPSTPGLSDLYSNHLSYSPIYEKLLTLIIQWTFALLTYYLHICSVIEEIRLSFGELPLTSYPSLSTKSHRGLVTSNFHPSFSY